MRTSILLLVLLMLICPVLALAQNQLPQPLVFEGDGLKIVVESYDEASGVGVSKGFIEMGGNKFPFTAKDTSETDASGTFNANGSEYAFVFSGQPNSPNATFKTGNSTYNVVLKMPQAPAPNPNPNPLDRGNQPAPNPNPLERGNAPAPVNNNNNNGGGAPANNAPFGVRVQPWTEGPLWQITEVMPGSLAAQAKLQKGDVLLDGYINEQVINIAVDQGNEPLKKLFSSPKIQLVVLRQSDQNEPIFGLEIDRTTGNVQRIKLQDEAMDDGGQVIPEGELQPIPPGFEVNPNNPGPRVQNNQPNQAAPQGVLVLKPHTFHDPGMGNMASHTIMIPADYKVEGQVIWNPQSRWSYANLIAKITDPKTAAELMIWPKLPFEFLVSQFPQNNQIGSLTLQGNMWMPLPQNAEQLSTQILAKYLRPQAQNVRFVNFEDYPQINASWEKLFAPLIQQMQQSNMQNAQMGMGGMQQNISFHTQRIRVNYTENGQNWDEDFYFVMMVQTALFRGDPSLGMGDMQTQTWSLMEFKSVRAPQGKIDQATGPMQMIAMSLRQTREYEAVMNQLALDLAKIDMKGAVERAEQNRKHASDMAKIRKETYDATQASYDRINTKFNDTVIREVEDWKDSSGDTHKLSIHYDVAWKNDQGQIIQTNDHNFNPGVSLDPARSWERMDRVN